MTKHDAERIGEESNHEPRHLEEVYGLFGQDTEGHHVYAKDEQRSTTVAIFFHLLSNFQLSLNLCFIYYLHKYLPVQFTVITYQREKK